MWRRRDCSLRACARRRGRWSWAVRSQCARVGRCRCARGPAARPRHRARRGRGRCRLRWRACTEGWWERGAGPEAAPTRTGAGSGRGWIRFDLPAEPRAKPRDSFRDRAVASRPWKNRERPWDTAASRTECGFRNSNQRHRASPRRSSCRTMSNSRRFPLRSSPTACRPH